MKCFVISPIDEDRSSIREHAGEFFTNIIAPVLAQFDIEPIRSDQMKEPGRISDQMYRAIFEYDLCIAVLTYANPNVYYELAVAQSASRPVVVLVEKGNNLPFDVSDYRVLQYDLSITSYKNKLHINTLAGFLDQLKKNNWKGEDVFQRYRTKNSLRAMSPARQLQTQAELTKAKEILNEFDRKAVSDRMHEENIYFMIKSLESIRIAVQTLGKSTIEDQQLAHLIEAATQKIRYITRLASELRNSPGKWQNSIFDLRIFGNSQPTFRFEERVNSENGEFDQAMEMVKRRIKAQYKKALNVDQVRARDIWDTIGPQDVKNAERDIDTLLPDVPLDVDTLASDFAVFYVFGMLDQAKQDIVELIKVARARVSSLSAELDK
jgi:hypothetical protein